MIEGKGEGSNVIYGPKPKPHELAKLAKLQAKGEKGLGDKGNPALLLAGKGKDPYGGKKGKGKSAACWGLARSSTAQPRLSLEQQQLEWELEDLELKGSDKITIRTIVNKDGEKEFIRIPAEELEEEEESYDDGARLPRPRSLIIKNLSNK